MSLQVVAPSIQLDRYQTMVRNLASDFRAGAVLPFLGAGISRDAPAGLPTAEQLVPPLVEIFRKALRSTLPWSSYSLNDLVKVRRILANARMERLLDVLHQIHGPSTLDYLDCLRGERWNVNHACLAALSIARCLPKCVTLNFDLLIEYAIAASRGRCTTRCPLTGHEFSLGREDIAATTILIKPHGSLFPNTGGGNPYRALTATLSQVGTRPNFKNIRALDELCTSGVTLFVAGYSDDDWDIFPILQSLERRFSHIVWVKYRADDRQAVAYAGALLREGVVVPSELGGDIPVERAFTPDPEFWALKTRVIPWLRGTGASCTLVLGRPPEVLGNACRILSLSVQPATGAIRRAVIEPSRFWSSDPNADERNVRTLLAFAALIRSSGEFARSMLLQLHSSAVVRRSPALSAQVEHHFTHTDHTDGYLLSAVRHMRRVVSMRRHAGPQEKYAGDVVWLGYEYLCLAKRPPTDRDRHHIRGPCHVKQAVRILTWFVFIPFWIVSGCWFLRHGVRVSEGNRRRELQAIARYYRADLLHNWGSYLFLLGASWVRAFRSYFSVIRWMYRRIEATDEGRELMSYDYYWMRSLEARLIAEWGLRAAECAAVDKKLAEIEHRNRLVQDHVQRGNTFAYRALLEFLGKSPDDARTRNLLYEAEVAWARAGGTMASGRRRVALFRRVTGNLSFKKAIEAMFADA